jgi:hypothetical protein
MRDGPRKIVEMIISVDAERRRRLAYTARLSPVPDRSA